MQDFEQLDYYTLLGLEPSASPDAVKRAYRQQIARYHPDRYVNAGPAEQAYAQLRAQRINEAYSVLSDPRARLAYNRGQRVPSAAPVASPPPPAPAPPAAPRDHQAELYVQASEHLAAGRALQAAAVLRQLQQINPFYRDSATLLAQAEAQLKPESQPRPAPTEAPSAPPARDGRDRRRLVAGAIGGAAAIGLVAAAFAWRGQRTQPPVESPTAVAAVAATAGPSPEPTSAPTAEPTAQPTAQPEPTAQPTAEPTAQPTAQPPPTEQPTLLPSPVLEEGTLRVGEDFENGTGWARAQALGWSVGYADSLADAGTVYQIVADPGVGNIWSYRTAPGDRSDYSVGVDMSVRGEGGSAGLLLRFQDRANYLICLINPSASTYRIEQRRFGRVTVVAEGSTPAQPAAITRLVARIQGSALTLVINGQIAAEAQADGLPDTPLYGLVAAAGDELVVAQFDNLELRDVGPGS